METETHRSMVNRVITMASRLGSSPRLLEAFLAIGERVADLNEFGDDYWGELEIIAQVKAGEVSHLKVGTTRSYQIRK